MKIATFVTTLFFATSTAAQVVDLSSGQTGRIEFLSSTPDHPWALVYTHPGRNKQQVVFGHLLMPKKIAEGTKVPAVVASHGSDGVTSTMHRLWARELNNAGVAVFIVDSYKPRGFSSHSKETRNYQNATANISDALHALKLLATHPQIDASKIFSLGWSTGGRVAMYAAFPAYQRAVVPSSVKWAGSIGLYPSGCQVRYRVEEQGTNPAPLLLLLAGKDDVTPARNCVEYADQLKADGHNVSYKMYPNAYHAFDRLDQQHTQVIDSSARNCNMEVTLPRNPPEPGKIGVRGYDFVQKKALITGKDWGDAYNACLTNNIWITLGTDVAATKDAVATTLEFIKENSK
jgi:dienelactone hydrolase